MMECLNGGKDKNSKLYNSKLKHWKLKGMGDNKYNYALGALKLIAAFEVVWIHFGKGVFGLRLAVPVFMFVSFYLLGCRGEFSVGDRARRLLIPFWFWGIIYCVIGVVSEGKFDWARIAYQLTLGSTYCAPLYFVMLMVLFTILVGFVKQGVALAGIAVLALVASYCGWNKAFFDATPAPIAYSLGRFAELLPVAVAGLLYGRYVKSWRVSWRLGGAAIGFMLVVALKFLHWDCDAGFGYSGAVLLVTATALSMLVQTVGEVVGDCRGMLGGMMKQLLAISSTIYFVHIGVGHLVANFVDSPSVVAGWFAIAGSAVVPIVLWRIPFLRRVV